MFITVKELMAPFEEQPVWVVVFYPWEEHVFLESRQYILSHFISEVYKGHLVYKALRHRERNMMTSRPPSPRAL